MPCHLDLSAQTVRAGCPPNSQRASGSYHAHRDGKRGRAWVRAVIEGGMSALGHLQTCPSKTGTSASEVASGYSCNRAHLPHKGLLSSSGLAPPPAHSA